ncbi:MAG TPA: hypothetical protein VGV35_16495 [Bryobacteraceae bacterium]|nr:hypothetical protein [Bryobacteraceae bacterium]
MKRSFVSLLFALLMSWTASAQDPARQLARILAEKGVLTSEELANVERAAPDEAVRLLTAVLYQKGILTQSEMAQVRGPAAPGGDVRYVPAVMTAATPVAGSAIAPPQSTSKQEATVPPVTAASKFPVQIYGTVLWNAFYNTAGTNIEDIPLVATKRGTDPFENFGMTARQTRFGLRYQGPEVMGGKLSGTVELDLFGGKAALGNGVSMDLVRLRLAYGRLDWAHSAIEAGQDWAVFSPLNPTSLASFAIPSMSASGNPWIRSPQFRYEWKSDSSRPMRTLLQLAALDPNVGDNPTTVPDARTPGIGERGRGPAVEARLALIGKIGDRDASVGFSSHYGRGKNVGTVGALTVARPVDSWGVNLDYTLPLDKHFILTGEAFIGRALGLFSVSSGQGVLPVGTPDGEHGVLARGGWAQAQINFNTKWQMNLAYGLESVDATNLRTGDRSKNQTYMTNLMYKLAPSVTLAWEWRRFLSNYQNQRALNAIGDTANMAISYAF